MAPLLRFHFYFVVRVCIYAKEEKAIKMEKMLLHSARLLHVLLQI